MIDLDRPGMDLDAAAVSDEAHDRDLASCRMVQHGAERVGVEHPGIVLADHPHRLLPAQLQRLEQAEELVHVGEPAPALAQIVDAGAGVARLRG